MYLQNESGYTLIESLLHCIVFIVAAFGISILLLIVSHVPTPEDVYEETEFEVVSFDLNRLLLKDVSRIEQKVSHKLFVYKHKDDEKFEILLKEPYLYRSKAGGFEPLIMNIKAGSSWHVADEFIKLQLVSENNNIMERAFYVPTVQK